MFLVSMIITSFQYSGRDSALEFYIVKASVLQFLMALREPKELILEPCGPLGKMSLPIRMYCQASSHDDALKDSML